MCNCPCHTTLVAGAIMHCDECCSGHDDREWLEGTQMLNLLKGERVVDERGNSYIVVTSAGDKRHPQLTGRNWFALPNWLYPTKVFRDRRMGY